MDGQDKNRSDDMIPKILADALAVSFDVQVGHNYLDDAEARFAFYTHTEERIPFDLDMLNKATGGGMVPKALYGVAAQSGGGKSIMMTHVAANTLRQGKNVLYITLEMSEEKIAERIDANLMNVEIDSLKKMTKDEFMTKIDKISSKTHGKLFIKEYPTSGAHVGHFRGLVEELKTKQNFIPDLICIDYLGICLSSRMKMGGSVNTNSYLKSVAEEMRGLAVELNVPILTGIQLNRGSYGSSDVDMSNIADSIGIAMTLDFFFALVQTEDLTALDQVLVQVMKNRYGDIMKFIVGLKKSKMQFYNLEESAQTSLMPRVPDSLKKSPQDSGFGQKKNDVSDWKF
jgi:replicative DNA helicase